MAYPITVIPGDSTGPASCSAVRRVLDATGVAFDWEEHRPADGHVTDAIRESALRTKTVLMGYHHGNRDKGGAAPIVQLRRDLKLHAAIRPAQTWTAIADRHPNVDLVVVRETTEDVYASLEHETIPGVYESLKITTRDASERIVRFGFEYARRHGRKKVTIVHKANILKMADGLFLRTAKAVAADYPDIECEDVIVDALCMKLTLHPERFDVLVCGNLFGDIVGDLASGLVGGTANSPSINYGKDDLAVFTVGHGAPKGTPGDQVNPLSLLFSSIFLLRHLGEHEAADRVNQALQSTLDAGIRPGGGVTCGDFAEAVAARL